MGYYGWYSVSPPRTYGRSTHWEEKALWSIWTRERTYSPRTLQPPPQPEEVEGLRCETDIPESEKVFASKVSNTSFDETRWRVYSILENGVRRVYHG